MCDEWMPVIDLKLTAEEFHRLPRNPAYKYEYLNGQAYLSPRPRHYHALLTLSPRAVPADAGVRPVRADDRDELEALFSGTFRTIQPFGGLDDATRREAARQCLERTWTGGDGPLIEQASFVLEQDRNLVGAIFVTLLPHGDPCEWDSYLWQQPPPANCIAERLGRPHLTWIFVSPWHAGRGFGTTLLAAAAGALCGLGYTELLSTFMLGNDSSMLWHWRNGFQLLAYPGSRRLMQERFNRHNQTR